MLLQSDVLERCEGGCLARDDYRDAKKFQQAEFNRVVGVKICGLNWLKSNGYISEAEYSNRIQHLTAKQKAKASGEPSPGIDGAAATASAPGPPPVHRRKVDKAEED